MTARSGMPRGRDVLALALRRLEPLVVLAVAAGVLAMHALTVGHHSVPAAASALTQSPALAASSGIGAVRDIRHHAGGIDEGTTGLGLIGQAAAENCAGCGQGEPGSSHTGSHLLDMCVAVLLAIALLSLLTRRTRRGSDLLGSVSWRQVGPSVSRRPRPPSLSQLCVLRT